MKRLLPLVALLPAVGLAEPVWVGRFASPDGGLPAPWQVVQLDKDIPPTRYRLREWNGVMAVEAHAVKSMALLARPLDIDLATTPVLCWRWRIDAPLKNADMATKAGDDYPVRVYAVVDGGLLGWRTLAVNYVWASARPAGSAWPNAYASQAKMLALQSGSARAGEWITDRRDLVSDFQRLHGASPAVIHGLAIMTDCDDVGQPMEGWYGEIRVHPR